MELLDSKSKNLWTSHRLQAFTLLETLISFAIMGVVLVSVFSGVLYGLNEVSLARENLRATQIILEKMEGIRLYTYDQMNNNCFPTNFSENYRPSIMAGDQNGTVYYGIITITNTPWSSSYSNDIRQMTVSLIWTNTYTSASVTRTRTMTTYVGRYGVQNYTFFN